MLGCKAGKSYTLKYIFLFIYNSLCPAYLMGLVTPCYHIYFLTTEQSKNFPLRFFIIYLLCSINHKPVFATVLNGKKVPFSDPVIPLKAKMNV